MDSASEKKDVTKNPRFRGFRIMTDDNEYFDGEGWSDDPRRAMLYKTRDEAKTAQKESFSYPTRRVAVLRPATIEDIDSLNALEYAKMSDRQRKVLRKLMMEMRLDDFFMEVSKFFDDQSDKVFKKMITSTDTDDKKFNERAYNRTSAISELVRPLAALVDMENT